MNLSILPASFLLASATFASQGFAQDSSPSPGDSSYVAGDFNVFMGGGESATLEDIVAAMSEHSTIFIGETHDDPTGHMLEFELLRRAFETYATGTDDEPGRSVALSLEFFQHDVQAIVDEYLAGQITEKAFLADSRPWPRYKTDYRPLIEFAKDSGLHVIAANAPRRYANRVSRLGRESLLDLSSTALSHLAPVPYGAPSEAYRDQWIQTIMQVMEQEKMKCGKPIVADSSEAASDGPAHEPPAGAHANMGNMLHSQVLWDATMAYWINERLLRDPDALVMHMVGSFHVARRTGTPEHLERYRPGTSSLVVVIRPVDDIDTFEPAPSGEWGDFVIQTDGSRTLEQIECARSAVD